MKKILFCLCLVLSTTLAYPHASYGLSASDEEAIKIESLRQQIKTLELRLAELRGMIRVAPRPFCVDLATDLSQQAAASQTPATPVTNLQRFLRSQGLLGVEPTGWYGPLTTRAVREFQTRHGLPVSGLVDAPTRAKIKSLSCPADFEAPAPLPNPIKFSPTSSTPLPVDPNPVACTMDAMMCPDGSYVGRVAPSCEFAACPTGPSTSMMTPVSDSMMSSRPTLNPPVGTSTSGMPQLRRAELMGNKLNISGRGLEFLRQLEYLGASDTSSSTGVLINVIEVTKTQLVFEAPAEMVSLRPLFVRPINLASQPGDWIPVSFSATSSRSFTSSR